MKISLNRNKIFIIGILIIAMFLVLNRIDFIFGSKVTTGEVVRLKYWASRRGQSCSPIIKFSTEEYEITFQGVENTDIEVKDKVDVIYKIADPTKAEVYSFVGFWLTPIIYCIIPVMLLISVVFSFLKPKQTIIVDLIKYSKRQRTVKYRQLKINKNPDKTKQ